MRNRFKELDLIDRLTDELWMEVCDIVQETDQDHPQEKEMQKKSKLAVWGGFTNTCEKKRSENKREKERYTHLNAEFQRTARRDKNGFLCGQCK